jgi:uncharacterized caspase-like protein
MNHHSLLNKLGFALALLLAPVQTFAETRVALVMGVWEYSGSVLAPLPGIQKDVDILSAKLKECGFEVSVVTNPTITEAEEAVDAFGKKLRTSNIAGNTVGLFYFSGHGGEFEGKNYLIPKGARLGSLRDVRVQGLAAERILNRMEESGGRVNLMFLDCCRNDMTKGSTNGLADMKPSGVFIGYATATNRESLGTEVGSPYTNALVKYMGLKGISIMDMHTMVTREVKNVSKELGLQQNPFQYSGLDSVFYFAPGDAPGTPVQDMKQQADYEALRAQLTELQKKLQQQEQQQQPATQQPTMPQVIPPTITMPTPPVVVETVPAPPPVDPGPWRFPDSSRRFLSAEEVSFLSKAELWRARNEIYARKGFIFNSEQGRRFMQALGSYYSGVSSNMEYIESTFNAFEKANVKLIQQYEKR